MVCDILVFLFVVSQRPFLKKRYQRCAEKVKEYLESIKDFDELVFPQSLFLHFLGPKPSTKVQNNLEVVKKSKRASPFLEISSFYFLLFFLLFYFLFLYVVFFLPRMMTRFSKQKLAEAQEKKAKGGIVSGLLSKKKTGDISKKDPVVTPPPTHSPVKHSTSPTSSLEVIASAGKEIRKKKKVGGKSFLLTFWDDADVAALKAHEVLSMDDLNTLMAKSSNEVMSSHIQKLVQVCAIGFFTSSFPSLYFC